MSTRKQDAPAAQSGDATVIAATAQEDDDSEESEEDKEQDGGQLLVDTLQEMKHRGGFIGLVASMLVPGVGPGVILFICSALVVFMSMCIVAGLAGLYSFHMIMLCLLATGLMASVLWSYSIRTAAERQHQAGEETSSDEESEDHADGDSSGAGPDTDDVRQRRGKKER
jgi:hypothetical protein